MFDPENFFDFQIKVPAYPFAQAFGAGGFKVRMAYGKIEQSQPP